MTQQYEFLHHIAVNFDYPQMLATSLKVLGQIKDDVNSCRSLWKFEEQRILQAEIHLSQRWGDVRPSDMEDEVKALTKKLREVKVERKCDAYLGIQDILKKWGIFCPLMSELRDPAMRDRHWTQLMGLTGKTVAISGALLLRDMWNMELHKNPDAVEETADQAKQEAKMEKTLAKLNDAWSLIEFDFEAHANSKSAPAPASSGYDDDEDEARIMLMKIKDEDFELLEENQVGSCL